MDKRVWLVEQMCGGHVKRVDVIERERQRGTMKETSRK